MSFIPETLYTRNLLHRKLLLQKTFPQRASRQTPFSPETHQKLLHQEPFTPGNFYTRRPSHQRFFLHQRLSTPKRSKIRGASHQRALTPHDSYKKAFICLHQVHQELLHQRAFTPEKKLHQKHFTPKVFTLKPKDLLHQNAFTPEDVFFKELLHLTHFTPKHKKTSMTPECKTQHDCANQPNPGLQNTMRLRTKGRPVSCKTCFLRFLRKLDMHETLTLTRLLRKFLNDPFFF